MNKKIFPLLAIVSIAALLTFFNVPLASSQGVTIVAAEVKGDLPVNDPANAAWQKASAVEVPLSAQNVAKPILANTKVKSVTVKSLYNDSQIALLIEWTDETKNDQMVRAQDFRDAVALQFAAAEISPFFCMGQLGNNVSLWHWKADWQADITARKDMQAMYENMYVDQYPFTKPDVPTGKTAPKDYTDSNYLPAMASNNLFASAARATPVESLIAGGFGTLTSRPPASQTVQGFGAWKNNKLQVIFARASSSKEKDDVSFVAGKTYPIAFAAWDGANNERNGSKSTSQWVSLQVGGAAPGTAKEEAKAPGSVEGIVWAFLPMLGLTLAVLGLAFVAFLFSKMPNK